MQEPRSGCPINLAVEALGDPWALIVLRDVMFGERRYFRELQSQSAEGIASNVLASRLKALVEAGLLTKQTVMRGQRARYSLTEAGIRTVPILVALGNWGLDFRGERHQVADSAARARSILLRTGGDVFVAQVMDELRAVHLRDEPVQTGSALARLRNAAKQSSA
ncbi:MAG: helix-turn-helix domain-containing protein [Nocardioides sp.]|uniref:winged helix-turn-helix transcriptional regulator n=1 Tax=Nocardioides sp. TaxID=35761 RepID=UPI0039E54023